MEKNIIKQLMARFEDGVALAKKNNRAFIGFLTNEECTILENSIPRNFSLDYMFWGGAENCERKYLGLSRRKLVAEDFPILALRLMYPIGVELSHRDFLGSFINSGISRTAIGDIFKFEDSFVAIVSENVADAILYSPLRVARYDIGVEKISIENLVVERSFEELEISVASLRLDAVVAEICNFSRNSAKELISSGRVRIGMLEISKFEKEIKLGEIISIRGFGKYIFDEIIGKTRRDRYKLLFRKYV